MKFLLPTNDLIFKLLFEHDPELLNSMLSAVLGREVYVEEILNPGIPSESVKDKVMVLDLRVRFTDGSRAFVEIQTTKPLNSEERFLGYLCRDYSTQPKRGQPYSTMTPTIGIIWHTGAPHPEHGFHEEFLLRGSRYGQNYSRALSLHLLQLGLVPREAPAEETEPERLARYFARFLNVKSFEELDELVKEEPKMTNAANIFRKLTTDPEVARLAIEREEAEYYYELALRKERELGEAAGRAEGKAEGEAIGLTRGKAEGKAETVLKLIALKFGGASDELALRVRTASVDELEKLTEKVLFASTAEDLF